MSIGQQNCCQANRRRLQFGGFGPAPKPNEIPMNIYKAMPWTLGQAGGRNERTVALVGKLGYFPPPV
jgi:hypothetical protein